MRIPLANGSCCRWNNQGPDEIVGVVGDVRSTSLETEPRPTSYLPPARFAYPFTTCRGQTVGNGMRAGRRR